MSLHFSRAEVKASATALFCGMLLPLALAPWRWWPLALAVTSVLALLMVNASPRSAFTRSLWFGLGQFGAGVSWVFVSINGYGEVPLPPALLMTGAFVALLAVVFALPFSLLGLLRRRHALTMLFAFPAAWVVSEWLRGWLFTGFPWLYLGYSQTDALLAPWAPVIGVTGISLLVAMAGSALAASLTWYQSRAAPLIGLATVLLTGCAAIWLDDKDWTQPAGEPLKIGMLQPALSLEQKWDREQIINILTLYRDMNQDLLDNDIIVWPESAIPVLKRHVDSYLDDTAKLVAASDAALILGIPTMRPATAEYFNSIIAIGEGSGIYHKQRLVPFGEYVPLEDWIRGGMKFFDLPMSSFSRGQPGQSGLRAKGHHIGAYICYEIAYPNLVAKTAGAANLLLTVSNDTWFGASIGPLQHFQMAQMRALENGKPLIRTTNDGISALVDHRGRLLQSIPQFTRATLEGTLTPRSGATPFNRFGNWPVLLLALLCLLPCLAELPFIAALFKEPLNKCS